MPNNLASEKSPYLQQHAENPVDWYPWGEEAFKKAKAENKPVFLSIGYATCHWCHVMAHESFEDPDIAKMMNEAFVNVKVDREERPDIDSTYMTVCQMLTGQGGWPLTIIMTPNKEPFFAGTYIPKEARFNRIGLRQLIPGVTGMWKNEPRRVEKATAKIREGFTKSQEFESGKFPGMEAVDFAAEQLAQRFDPQHGGFGEAPKFPSPHNLMFLLRQWKLTGEDRFIDMVSETLTQMRLGGIWDHIGYGFHRYSTDREWLLPHFEKMLYDQALLMMAFTECWQITKKPLFKQTVYEIADYLERNLSHPAGGFYSAEDADSEGEEGKFYVWEKAEIESVLSASDASTFNEIFGITSEGNFEDEASQKRTGKNIPHLSKELSESESEWFTDIRSALFKERESRIHPLLDDKVLTDWNALMIAALSRAGFAFNEQRFTDLAERATQFLKEHLRNENKLLHRFKDGEAGIPAMGDDHAFLIWAYIELYEATFNPEYLREAVKCNQQFLDQFWDEKKGGFFFSIIDEDQVYGRQRQIFDGAIPSSNSVAMMNLIRLSRLTGNTELEEYADRIGKAFSADLIRSGASICHGMQSIQFLNGDAKEITLSADPETAENMLLPYREKFSPFSIHHIKTGNNQNVLDETTPYTASQNKIDGKPALYVCEHFTCEKPVTGLNDIKKVFVK
ncbi:MAG TPA: thioredoxin domain-containing protein [Gracilimonas sp.]|uniref:thioredoxin domain-containing protein n=1 Tax=Gracilimonas sp. TaxID=1974203 RepID=UPI002DB16565|nr:thioredoxin domain-containing protein [Gracilimonas sp.]